MQNILQTASVNLLRVREQFTPLTEEADMLAVLLASYDPEDRVSLGIARVFDRWLAVLSRIETELETVQDDLSRAKCVATPAEPEQSPGEKLEGRCWQASRIREIADDLEREAHAAFAAWEALDECEIEQEALPLTLDLSEHESHLLAEIARREDQTLTTTASSLLSGALRRLAAHVAGGSEQ